MSTTIVTAKHGLHPIAPGRIGFQQSMRNIEAAAMNAVPGERYGILPSVVGLARFRVLFPQNDIPEQELIPTKPAADADIPAVVFKLRTARYVAYVAALQSFRAELWQCLNEEARDMLESITNHGILTIHQLLEHLENEFGELVFTDVVTLLAELDKPWPANSNINDILSSLNKTFETLATVPEPVSDFRKILALRTATANLPTYQTVFERFFIDHGRLRDQQYKDLVKMIKEHRNNNGVYSPSSNPYASANAASIRNPPNPPPSTKNGNGNVKPPAVSGSTPKNKNLAWPNPKQINHCTGYCAQHGFGNHDTIACRSETMAEELRRFNLNNYRECASGSRKVARQRDENA